MDEFNLFQGLRSFSKQSLYHTLDPIKTVFGTEIFRVATLAPDSTSTMLAGRMLGLCAALGTMALLFLISREMWPSTKHRLLVLVCALSYSNFFERAFRIRTDTLALTFAVGSLLFVLRGNRNRTKMLVSGVLMGASFLCTQKSIYFLMAYAMALLVATWSTDGWKKSFTDFSIFMVGWLASFTIYAIYFGGRGWWRVIYMALLGPKFVMEGTASFSGLGTFIQQTLTRNIIPYALSAAGLTVAVARWKSVGFPIRFTLIATPIITFLIFHHDQPWPYVFVWPQALLALWVIPLAEWMADRRRLTWNRSVLAIALLAALSFPRQIRYFNHTNDLQISVMKEADRLLEPQSTYFDGVGMIVDRDIAGTYPGWWWDVPTISRTRAALQSGDERPIQSIMNSQPKLWIGNYRILNMSDIVNKMVDGGYIRVSSTILLSGTALRPGTTQASFACHWAGRYDLFDENGKALSEPFSVDGMPPSTSADMLLGLHRVQISSSSKGRFLLPAGTALPNGFAGSNEPLPDLFSEVYTY